jgi:hypothetical protein
MELWIRLCDDSLGCDVLQGNTAADAASSATSQPEAAAVVVAADPAAAGEAAAAAAAPSSSSSSAGGVSLLTSAEPIDRLRYQAVLVFEHFDTAKAGQLTADQVQQFFVSSARKVSVKLAAYTLLKQHEVCALPVASPVSCQLCWHV